MEVGILMYLSLYFVELGIDHLDYVIVYSFQKIRVLCSMELFGVKQ